jgi:transposase
MMERLSSLHRRVAGIDVHRMLHVATVLIERPDGSIDKHSRAFGGFKRDCRALAAWLTELQVQLVVMQSTGIYWKSVYAHLQNAGITAWVVNAHFIKHVPGRKTDMLDSEWLAVLTRLCSPERLACGATLSPGNHESAGKRKSGRARHGNNTIRCLDDAATSGRKNAPCWIKQLEAIGTWPAPSAQRQAPRTDRPLKPRGRAQRVRI